MGEVFLARAFKQDEPSQPDLDSWFGCDGWLDDPSAASKALDRVARWLASKGAAMKRTPAGAGMSLLLRMLPYDKDHRLAWYPLPDDLQLIIRANLPQASVQFIGGDAPTSEITVYDARAAYMAVCRHVPCYVPALKTFSDAFHYTGHVEHDTLSTFAGWLPAFYRVEVTVPPGWRHIGLAPKKHPNQMHPDYPRTPGESWETWIDGCEIPLLQAHGWPFAIRERIVFHNDTTRQCDPLRFWVNELAAQMQHYGDHPDCHELQYRRAAYRAMALHTIGYFHSRGNERTVMVGPMRPVPEEVPEWATVTPHDGGGMNYTWRDSHKGLMAAWNHPEWAAHIWARWRYKLHRKALEAPVETILGIYTDAVYTRGLMTSWDGQNTGNVGEFRVKEHAVLHTPAFPSNWDELHQAMEVVGEVG